MFDDVINGADGALDKIEGVVGGNSIGGLGGNTILDPATDMRKTIADIFVAIIEIFSFLSGMFKI